MNPTDLLLSLATSTPRCSAALLRGPPGVRPILSRETEAGPGRSGDLLVLIQALLAEADARPTDIDLIAFDAGPGAFTGLRVACGVAQGLGFALTRPVVPVSAFEAIDPGPQAARLRLLAIDARMSEVYFTWSADDEASADPGARLVGRNPSSRSRPAPAVGPGMAAVAAFETAWREVAARPGGLESAQVVAVGSGFVADPSLARWALERGCRVESEVWPDAVRVARCGWALAEAGQTLAPEAAAPLYVRDKVALDSQEQAAARAARGVEAGSQQ